MFMHGSFFCRKMAFSLILALLVFKALEVLVDVGEFAEGLLRGLIVKKDHPILTRTIMRVLMKKRRKLRYDRTKAKEKASKISRKKKGVGSPPCRSTGGPVIREGGVRERQSRSKLPWKNRHNGIRLLLAGRALAERYVNYNEFTREVPYFGQLLHRVSPLGGFRHVLLSM